MLFSVVWYTILCVALNKVVSGGGSNLMNEEDIKLLTPTLHAEREAGSKWVYVSEHSFLLAIWAMKACMLIIYARITYVPPWYCGMVLEQWLMNSERDCTKDYG